MHTGCVRRENSMLEKWAQIEGYEGFYEVSDMGNVRSMERVVPRFSKGTLQQIRRVSRPLRHSLNHKGYPEVTLTKGAVRNSFRVHRLVAAAFCPGGPQEHVNHINSIRDDNRAVNLEWCTAQENVEHAIKNDLKNWGRKAIVGLKDGEAVHFFESAGHAGRAGFNKGNISSALTGRLKTSGGFSWVFAEVYFNDLV